MDKNKRNTIIFACLFAVAIGIWIKGLMYKPPIPADPGQAPSGVPIGNDVVQEGQMPVDVPLKQKEIVKINLKSKYDVWGRSPFINLNETTSEEDTGKQKHGFVLRLTGIMWDEKYPMAVINNKILKIGDIFLDRKLIEIKQDSVVIEQNGVVTTLKVWKEQK